MEVGRAVTAAARSRCAGQASPPQSAFPALLEPAAAMPAGACRGLSCDSCDQIARYAPSALLSPLSSAPSSCAVCHPNQCPKPFGMGYSPGDTRGSQDSLGWVLAASPARQLPGEPGVQILGVQLSARNISLRCSFLYHSRSYVLYLFTVSNSNAFLLKHSCCTASELTLQLRPWAFVKISWKQTSSWPLTPGGVRIWAYLALLASLYHQPNQNLGSMNGGKLWI